MELSRQVDDICEKNLKMAKDNIDCVKVSILKLHVVLLLRCFDTISV